MLYINAINPTKFTRGSGRREWEESMKKGREEGRKGDREEEARGKEGREKGKRKKRGQKQKDSYLGENHYLGEKQSEALCWGINVFPHVNANILLTYPES